MDVLVECKGLKKSYGKIPVIKELDLSLERGRIIGILGPNGSCLLYTSDAADD